MMHRQIEKIKSDIANLQAESRELNARIDELIRELKNNEQFNEKGTSMTPKEQKKYEKKVLKARERFQESARELVRLYGQNPEACAGLIDGMMIPGAPGFLCPWIALLGPSVVMTKRASDAALRLREGAIQQVKDKLGAEKYEELKNEIKEMLGARTEGQKDKEEEEQQ